VPAINQLQPLLLLPQAAQFIPRLCCLRRVLAQFCAQLRVRDLHLHLRAMAARACQDLGWVCARGEKEQESTAVERWYLSAMKIGARICRNHSHGDARARFPLRNRHLRPCLSGSLKRTCTHTHWSGGSCRQVSLEAEKPPLDTLRCHHLRWQRRRWWQKQLQHAHAHAPDAPTAPRVRRS
jgi:hypothetical protein